MQKFKEVPAKISAQKLQNTPADLARTEAMKSRTSLDTKHYIKQNYKVIQQIETDVKENKQTQNE